ncbi:MAG: helix-turn-helix transcriptional regulator [Firmicutes bacterium]|nr:helix-turn-helix transcriptional regulator [Bacillota bacterium]
MTPKILLMLINEQLWFPLGLHLINSVLQMMIFLKLGLKILKADKSWKDLLMGGVLLGAFNLFVKPFISYGLVAFFLPIVVIVLALTYYSKARLIICTWVCFLCSITTTLGPVLVISPLAAVNPIARAFFLQNPYGLLISGLLETSGLGILLIMLALFKFDLIPSPGKLLRPFDFFDIYLFLGVIYWFYRSTMNLFTAARQGINLASPWPIIDWLVAGSLGVAYYFRKVYDQKKYERMENKINELTNSLNAAQPCSGTIPKAYLMLDPREREVLKLLALAKPIKAIAAQLFMDRKTVSNYITRICDKLEMEKEHLPVYAFAIGLVSKEECNIKDELNIKVR